MYKYIIHNTPPCTIFFPIKYFPANSLRIPVGKSAKIKIKYLFLWMPVRKIEILIDFHTPTFREKYTFNLVTSLPEFWSELRWWLRYENVVHFLIQIHWDYITEITLNNTDFFLLLFWLKPILSWILNLIYLTNVCYKNKYTKRSSVLLLCLVYLFS